MRRPVEVKSFYGWVSSYLMFFFAQIFCSIRGGLGRRSRPSAASSSGALRGAAASHSWVIRAKKNTRMLLSRAVFTTLDHQV